MPRAHIAIRVSFLLSIVGFGFGLVLLRPGSISAFTAVLALMVILLGAFPIYYWISKSSGSSNTLPLMGLTGLYYAVFYGGSVFLLDFLWMAGKEMGLILYNIPSATTRIQQEDAIQINELSVLVTLIGVCSMVCSYFLSRGYCHKKIPPLKLISKQHNGAIRLLTWGLIFWLVVYLLFSSIYWIAALGSFVVPAGMAALCILYAFARTQCLKIYEKVMFFLVILPLVVIKLISNGFLTPLLMLAIYFILLEIWIAKRIPWRVIIGFPIIFILVYPVMHKIRAVVWTAKETVNVVQKVEISFRILLSFYGVGDQPYISDFNIVPGSRSSFHGLITRISHQALMARVVQATPSEIPYWGGVTYQPLISKFVPRIFWGTKPQEKFGNLFGRRYGFVPPEEKEMSVNLPWLPELYANFGWSGVVVGMGFFGLLFAALEPLFLSARAAILEGAVGISLIAPLFYQESNFSLMFGNVPLIVIALLVYFRVGHSILVKTWNWARF